MAEVGVVERDVAAEVAAAAVVGVVERDVAAVDVT